MKQRLISLPFLLLRMLTAGGAFATGFFQTFVFAHELSPQRFSIFILVSAFGYSLWFCDLGIVKLLFVRLRAHFLAGGGDDPVAGHASAIVQFYIALALGGAVLCFAVMVMRPAVSIREAAEFGLFFLFVTLNLVWFALRNIAIAVDEYVLFESLETTRRTVYIAGLAAMLAGLPLLLLFIAMNAVWAVVLANCLTRMVERGALAPQIAGFTARLFGFFRANGRELMRSATYAASELYYHNFPYLIVPALFGLGAPTIILDTTLKVFNGIGQINGAACDILVPRQTSALAERDGPTMIRATWLAAALCSVPALLACGVLIFAADKVFAILLGPAATMPPQTTPILVMLLIGNLVKMVTHSVLVHNGYFRDIARIGVGVAAAMTGLAAIAIVARFDIVQFLDAYAAVYACGALATVALMIRGPIRRAHETISAPQVAPW